MALPFCALYLDFFLFVLQVNLCHSTKHWIVPTNARAVLFVRSFSVTYLIKFRLETEKKRKQTDKSVSFLSYVIYRYHIPLKQVDFHRTIPHSVACGAIPLVRQQVSAVNQEQKYSITTITPVPGCGNHRVSRSANPFDHNSLQQMETYRQFASTKLFTDFEPSVANTFDISLQSSTKILKHGRSTRQYNVLIQWPSHINRAVLNDCVNNFGYRRRKIGIGKLQH